METRDKSIKRAVLFVVALSSFITPFMGSAINIALPAIGSEFSLDAVMLNWVATSYLLSAAFFLLPLGRLADIHGKKGIFTGGAALFLVSCAAMVFAPGTRTLLLFRAIQGLGSAMIFGTSMALLTLFFAPGERGRAMGWSVATVYLGLSLGPVLGGWLTFHFGWRSIFLFNVPLCAAILLAVGLKLKGPWEEQVPAGAPGPDRGFFSPIFGIFKGNPLFAYSSLAALINYSATFSVVFLLSLYFQYVKGMDARQAGLVLLSQPLVMTLCSPLAGRLSDRIEPRIVASAGMAMTSGALILLCFTTAATPTGLIIAILLLLGLGFALFSSPNTNAAMSAVSRKSYGTASAVLGTARLTGHMVSMALVMAVFSIFIGRVPLSAENSGLLIKSMRAAFLISGLLCLAGVFASLARGDCAGKQALK